MATSFCPLLCEENQSYLSVPWMARELSNDLYVFSLDVRNSIRKYFELKILRNSVIKEYQFFQKA
jgi:hypothetical protein